VNLAREGLQKIDLKLLLEAPRDLDADFLLAVFGRWRLEEGQEIVDLADYAHVDHGPSCILISHRWHFGLTFSGGEPGLLYSSRKDLAGSDEERVIGAARGLVALSQRLVGEPEFPRDARPDARRLDVVFNDRTMVGNDGPGDTRCRPAVEALAARLHGPGAYALAREPDPKRRLGYRIEGRGGGLDLEEMRRKLS
jgi:hypothetical protein